jgi:hypothetical protein
MGVTWATFKESGNTPVFIDKFINDDNCWATVTLHCLTTLAGMLSAPVAFFYINSIYDFFNSLCCNILKVKLLSISTWFFISTILGCVERSYTTLCPILSATVEKKELKFSETSFASFMILLFSQRIIFCSPELHFFRKERFYSCPKITSFGTSKQVNNAYMQYQDTFIHILNKHAPVKTRRPRQNPLPCMNSELRGAI